MKHWLGLVVVALSAGLFADEAHGSPVYEWSYPGAGTSHFGYSDGDHDGDHDGSESHSRRISPDDQHLHRRFSIVSFGGSRHRSWNDDIDAVHDWGRDSYLRWSFTWSGGSDPGKDYDNSCDPEDDKPEHPKGVGNVPVPAAAMLFGSGLAFIFGVGQHKKRRPNTSIEV